MGKKIGIGVLGLIVVLAVIVATRPSSFQVSRSTTVSAPPAELFALVHDFHNFAEWSPWEKLDPSMKRTFSGPPRGVGAKYEWVGNDQVGEGSMTIERETPDAEVVIELHFIKPFSALNTTTFAFAPAGADTTTVTWSMSGHNDFFGKAFSLVMNMDKMVGGDFERGLATMKSIAESRWATAKRAREQAAATPPPVAGTATPPVAGAAPAAAPPVAH